MFKLIRLAVYGLIGYGLYHFVTDVINAAEERSEPSRGGKSKAAGSSSRMTGKRKTGKAEETADVDGGSTLHRVGRGVV